MKLIMFMMLRVHTPISVRPSTGDEGILSSQVDRQTHLRLLLVGAFVA